MPCRGSEVVGRARAQAWLHAGPVQDGVQPLGKITVLAVVDDEHLEVGWH